MEYYYSPRENIDEGNGLLKITGDEYRHLSKSLRKKPGDEISVTDGKLNVYFCRIEKINSKEILCSILKKKFNLNEPEIEITLFLCQLKNMDRFEFAVEKSVELGVKKIIPVISKYTVARSKMSGNKFIRLQKIILSAMKQSQRCFLPEITESVSFEEMLSVSNNFLSKIVLYEFADSKDMLHREVQKGSVALLTGPEGGFSGKEIEMLKNNDWKVMSLGERKLRAETAAVVSVYKILQS